MGLGYGIFISGIQCTSKTSVIGRIICCIDQFGYRIINRTVGTNLFEPGKTEFSIHNVECHLCNIEICLPSHTASVAWPYTFLFPILRSIHQAVTDLITCSGSCIGDRTTWRSPLPVQTIHITPLSIHILRTILFQVFYLTVQFQACRCIRDISACMGYSQVVDWNHLCIYLRISIRCFFIDIRTFRKIFFSLIIRRFFGCFFYIISRFFRCLCSLFRYD